MIAIVCVDKNWGIGKENQLLFSLPLDMKFFRETTLNKVVVMGGNTLRSFPNGNLLPKRTNVVLSRTEDRKDCIVVKDLESLLSHIKRYDSDQVYIIGGASVYKSMIEYCDKALVTKVDEEALADTFFPNLDQIKGWEMVKQSEEMETNGRKIRFTEYVNNNKKEI